MHLYNQCIFVDNKVQNTTIMNYTNVRAQPGISRNESVATQLSTNN